MTHIAVHPNDQPIVKHWPLSMRNGPWIAGGAALHWYQNQSVDLSDIDLYFKSAQQLLWFKAKFFGRKQLSSTRKSILTNVFASSNSVFSSPDEDDDNTYDIDGGAVVLHDSDDALTLRHNDVTIQLIRKQFYNSPDEIIQDFDISVCQIVTDGHQFVLGEHTASDIRHKRLRLLQPKLTAIKRVHKYISYGYRPVEGTIKQISEIANIDTDFVRNEDYA